MALNVTTGRSVLGKKVNVLSLALVFEFLGLHSMGNDVLRKSMLVRCPWYLIWQFPVLEAYEDFQNP